MTALTAGIPRETLFHLNLSSCLPASLRRTLSIPFASREHAIIAKRVVSVDRELNQHLVERQMEIGNGGELKV